MKCAVCFSVVKEKKGVCSNCFYCSNNLTTLPNPKYIEVVCSQSYQAFARMLDRHRALEPNELKMKLYSDSGDAHSLIKLLGQILQGIDESLSRKRVSSPTRTILELKKQTISRRINYLKETL
jgi:hypothetical protein